MPIRGAKKIGFLVHPRDRNDFIRKFPFFRYLPTSVVDFATMHFPPVVVSPITGLRNKQGDSIDGYIIAITMTAHQMTNDREGAIRQIRRAVRYAERKGVGIMGFGAMTASFTQGGKILTEDVEKLGITTGRAYTAKTVTDYAKQAIADFSLPLDRMQLAVVGAAGSIGSSCTKILAQYGVRRFILVDLERKRETIQSLTDYIESIHPENVVTITHQIPDIRSADMIIAATSSPEIVIGPDDLAPGAIILNDAQPSDVSPEVIVQRDDVLVVEAGVIRTPGVRCNFNLGLVAKDETFCCLGEALILAHDGHFAHYALGELDLDLITDISERGKKLGFTITPYQYQGRYVTEARLNCVREAIHAKYGN